LFGDVIEEHGAHLRAKGAERRKVALHAEAVGREHDVPKAGIAVDLVDRRGRHGNPPGTVGGFSPSTAMFMRARCLVNIHLTRARRSFRCRSHSAISASRILRLSMRRSRHWVRRTPISISTMLSHEACLGV